MRRRVPSFILVALTGLAPASRAQDPVPLYPANYKVLFENSRNDAHAMDHDRCTGSR